MQKNSKKLNSDFARSPAPEPIGGEGAYRKLQIKVILILMPVYSQWPILIGIYHMRHFCRCESKCSYLTLDWLWKLLVIEISKTRDLHNHFPKHSSLKQRMPRWELVIILYTGINIDSHSSLELPWLGRGRRRAGEVWINLFWNFFAYLSSTFSNTVKPVRLHTFIHCTPAYIAHLVVAHFIGI